MRRSVIAITGLLVGLCSAWIVRHVPDEIVARNEMVSKVSRILDADDDVWEREKLFYEVQHIRRYKSWSVPVHVHQFQQPVYTNPDRVRILVVGDSYTDAYGLVDNSFRWGSYLERLLDEQTEPGTFEVVTIARPGASSFTYAAWVEQIASNNVSHEEVPPGAIESLQGTFDALIVSFVNNDVVPAHWDTEYDNNIPRTPDAIGKAQQSIEDNPYWEEFRKVPQRLSTLPGDPALMFIHLSPDPALQTVDEAVQELFEQQGFHVAPIPEVRQRWDSYDYQDLLAHPKDNHPSAVLHEAFAQDAARALLQIVDPMRLRRAQDSATQTKRSAVSNAAPAILEVESSLNGAVVHLPASGSRPLEPCVQPNSAVDVYIECTDDGSEVYHVHDRTPVSMRVLCAALGRPYVQVVLDKDVTLNQNITVTNAGPTPIAVYTFGYDSQLLPAVKLLDSNLAVERSVSFVSTPAAHGIMVSVPGYEDCPLESDAPIDLPKLHVSLTWDD